jgi:Flp pilus assembly protein TadD
MNSSPDGTGFQFAKVAFTGVFALGAGLALAGCTPPANQSQNATITSATRMSIADIAASGGDTESARSILAAAAAADPKNGDVGIHYAQALLDSGRPQEAVAAARQVVDRAPRDAALVVRAAQLELRAGDPLTASAAFQSVATHGGGTPALNGLGVSRAQLGDLSGAEDAFRRAVELSPGDYAARNNLALALVLQGRAAEAVPMLQSLADEPGVPGRVKHNLALAYARQGNTDRAASVLAGVVSSAAASREVANFSTSRAESGTLVASRLAPAEIMDGRTSGPAYAGIIPPPTGGSGQPVAIASAEPTAAPPRPAPVAIVAAAPAKVEVAATSAPLSPREAAAPVLLPATVVAGPVPRVITPSPVAQPPVLQASVVTPVAKPAPPPPPAPQQVATVDTAPPPSAVGPASVAVTEPTDNGAIRVRIAAVPTQSAALAMWQNLTGLVPDLLTGRTPVVKMDQDNGKPAWRLGTGGFRDVAAAEQFCRKLRERGPNCTLGL